MILECPNCETRYETPVELPPEGRKVRCASCQHVWNATAADQPAHPPALPDFDAEEIIFKETENQAGSAQDAPAEPEPVAENTQQAAAEESAAVQEQDSEVTAESGMDAEDEFSDSALEQAFSAAVAEAQPGPAGDILPSNDDDFRKETGKDEAGAEAGDEAGDEAESPPIVIGKARLRRAPVIDNVNAAAGWACLALILAGVAGIAYFQRVNVVRALPGTASAYERIGLPVNVRGLKFEKVKYSWVMSAGRPVLEVYGDIVNVTPQPLKVPTVVFGLRTKEKVEVYQWAADVRTELLPAAERTAFAAQIPTPPKSIRDVQVRFAKVR
ncbi:MAG: zinc-ribbon domain-containing protein [Methyloligellaceae bacterium]